MKIVPTLKFAYVMLFFCVSAIACGQTQEVRLQSTLFSEDHGADTFRALSMAFNQNRKDLLLVGLDNPNVRIREVAAKKLCELPSVEHKDAFITVLQKDSLWIETEGSRNLSLQQGFVDDIKSKIRDHFHINASNIDLFDLQARVSLIKQIRRAPVR